MNFVPAFWILGLIILAVAALWLVAGVIVPTLFHLLIGIIPFLLMILAIVSCVRSDKQANIKILWILICIFAPIVGPLLWFLWGKQKT